MPVRADPRPSPSRRAFWIFAAIIALALAGGGLVALLGRRSVAGRKGHPDTIAPASRPAPGTTPTSTSTARDDGRSR